jgi:hypothetical protein
MKVTYAVTACNEHRELESLLNHLNQYIRVEDEILIQLDTNHSEEVMGVCDSFKRENTKLQTFPLNGDFASFKNAISFIATGDFIFQIDADEIPCKELLENLPLILEHNPNNEVYLVPRINTVDGITQDHIKQWNWIVNDKGHINFPDYQWRIYKNISYINWVNKVHERLDGFKTFATLPAEPEYCLLHHKSIEKQEKQNKFYSKL